MITQQNIKQVIKAIDNKDLLNVINAEWDEVVIILNVFNSGFNVEIETTEQYDEEQRQEFIDNGNLVMDKDSLISLIDELAINTNL